MSTRYPGGLISRSAPVMIGPVGGEGGSAPGIWTLEQASYYKSQGTWPIPNKVRTLFTWGENGSGQLGINSITSTSLPVQVGGDTNWISGTGGDNYFVFIKTDGTLWSWGNNGNGRLGQGDAVSRSSPTQIGALTNWSSVSSGGSSQNTFAIKIDGTLWAWGPNSSGQLGVGNRISRSSPVQIGSDTWTKTANNGSFAIAIKPNGTLWAWGENGNGELAQNNVIYRSSPVQIGALTTWASIGASFGSILAIRTNGTLWAWGKANDGSLGNSNVIFRSSPVQVGALTSWAYPATGANYYSMATRTNGTLWSWGANYNGCLGQNDTIYKSSPVQVGPLTTWSRAVCANYLSIALKTDGTVWSWGDNGSGQLGQNDLISRSSPVQVGSSTSWASVYASTYSGGAIQAANQ